MIIGNTIKLEDIFDGKPFYYGEYTSDCPSIAVLSKSVDIVVQYDFVIKYLYFDLYNLETFKFICSQNSQDEIVKIKIDEGIFREIVFDNDEEAKFYLSI